MLGKLARWLRMLGYDTAYERNIADPDVVNRVLKEDRWLLARDRYLVKRKTLKDRCTLIRSDYLTDQLRQLRHELQVKLVVDDDTLCRCAECNHLLEMIPPSEAAFRVPRFVAKHFSDFASCPYCGRLYWSGTHWAHFQRQLQHLNNS